MATLRIKRRLAAGGAGAPSTLANGELAFNEASSILYYGAGDSAGLATSIIAIGGAGAVVMLTGAQTIAGIKTFSSFPVTPSAAPTGNYDAANKKYVDDSVSGLGGGDMLKSVYDPNNDGSVLEADHATAADTVPWSGTSVGRPTTFPPSPHNHVLADITDAAAALALKADLASPTFTGVPLAPTAAAGTNTTQIATTAHVFAGLALKANAANAALTGVPTAPTAAVGVNTVQIATTAFVQAAVDLARTGLTFKNAVRVATTANLAALSGLLTVDGVTLVAGDRILVKNQTAGAANGIYDVASGAWTRSSDFDTAAEIQAGAFMFVEEGTTQADTAWVLSTDGTIVVGTTVLAFAQFSSAGDIVAGNGLTRTGNTLTVGGTANRITVGATTVDIASTYVGQTSITTLGTVVTGTIDGGTF